MVPSLLERNVTRILIVSFMLMALAGCSGCSTVDTVLTGLDAGCVDVEMDGYFTDSKASGRGIKVPEGTEVTPALVETLCGKQ
jgi:uncharacterized membrane protein